MHRLHTCTMERVDMAQVNAIKTITIVGKVKKEVKTEGKITQEEVTYKIKQGVNGKRHWAGSTWKKKRANREVKKDQHRDHGILVWSKVMAQVKRHRFKSLSVQVFFTLLLHLPSQHPDSLPKWTTWLPIRVHNNRNIFSCKAYHLLKWSRWNVIFSYLRWHSVSRHTCSFTMASLT